MCEFLEFAHNFTCIEYQHLENMPNKNAANFLRTEIAKLGRSENIVFRSMTALCSIYAHMQKLAYFCDTTDRHCCKL